jgi:hypothetical protein
MRFAQRIQCFRESDITNARRILDRLYF